MSKGGESLGPVPGVVGLFLAGRASSKGRVVPREEDRRGRRKGLPLSLYLLSFSSCGVKEREPSITGPVGRMRLI